MTREDVMVDIGMVEGLRETRDLTESETEELERLYTLLDTLDSE